MTQSSNTASNIVLKIAEPKEEQAAQKQFIKDVEGMADTKDKTGAIVSERHKDQFFGGPLHGTVCTHQPNGPRAYNDPKGYWSDYYFKDTMRLPEVPGGVKGYHLYSTVRNIYGTDGYIAKGHASKWGMGSRTTNFRKCYYYIGFFDEGFLACEGITPGELKGVLTLGY